MTPQAYLEKIAEPLRRRPTRHGEPMGPIPPGVWFAPPSKDVRVSLKHLYDAGVICGHGPSRAVLDAEVGQYDAQLEQAMRSVRERSEATQQAAQELARAVQKLDARDREMEQVHRAYEEYTRHLQSEVERARDRAAEFEASTFWRATYPLRAMAHGAKVTARFIRTVPHRARLVGPRLATAGHIARDQGVLEVFRRVAMKARARLRRPRGLPAGAELENTITALHVPSSAEPLVSVVIPTYGQDLHTFTCLKAIATEAANVPLEVIVMDDCAPQPASEALSAVTGVQFHRNAQNLGFVRNCNAGIARARGRYVLLLNNDAVVMPGGIGALLDVFSRHADAGAVGSKLVYPDGRLQEAGAIVWRDATAWNYGRDQDPDAPEYNYVRRTDYCSAACLLVPRQLLAELGGFDERYVPAYCEDTDLCFRIRDRGLQVYYQPAAQVVHFEGVSHGTSTTSGVKSYQVENQAKFRERWSGVLGSHRINGVKPRLEADRGAARRILFVEACVLTPDHDSGSLRTWRLIEIMQQMGCKVTFIADNLERREPYTSQLQQMGVEMLHGPHVRSVADVIRERGDEFDVIILARYYVAANLIDVARKHAPRATLVLDTIDLHFLRQRRLAALQQSATLAQSAEAIYRQEIDCIARCDVTWVVSEVESELLSRELPRSTVLIVTNIHDVIEDPTPFARREGLVFVGGYRHPPNVDAAQFFVREIAPLLRDRLPGVKTYLIGSNAPRAVLDLRADNVEVTGYVPDIEPWLDRCRLSISPLRYGAGVKGKINQAMSRGLPVIATTPSVEGMHLVEGEEVLVADGAHAFADAVARAYRDEALWTRLSRGGIENVRRHFSRDVARRSLERLFSIVDSRREASARKS